MGYFHWEGVVLYSLIMKQVYKGLWSVGKQGLEVRLRS